LEPAYAKAFADLEVIVFYDAGEEAEARKDALTLSGADASTVRVVEWPNNAPHGADVNGRLTKGPDNFEEWLSGMIEGAKPLASTRADKKPNRKGERDRYGVESETSSGDKVRGDATEDFSRFSRNGHKLDYPPWPVLDDAAFYGLPGVIVKAVEPHTEADSVAVLLNLLVAVGNAAGRGAYVQVEADRHHLNLNAALVGETAKGRKGTSFGYVKQSMHAVDERWAEDRILNGLSSGEGLIFAVRDPVVSEDKSGDMVVVDPGVADKRLLVVEGEFGRVLKVMTREGNTLSAVIRAAWDGERLSTMTRNSPLKATGAHISVIGHITRAELLRLLSKTDTENGFANRFLWVLVRRSKVLPFGGEWGKVNTAPLVKLLGVALECARGAGAITWGESAKGLWEEVYPEISEGKAGLFGAATSRAEAQALRLAALYAALDDSSTIEEDHLRAALALWEYAEQSARYIFGDACGDPVADRIVEALQEKPNAGLTRNEIMNLFNRHVSSERIGQALEMLQEAGRVRCEYEPTGGRPVERWFLA
jgi:hypothetical protein